jgi:hypothetical protein
MKTSTFGAFLLLTGVSAAAATSLSGCIPHPHHHHLHSGRPLVVAAKLDCPDDQGRLTRVSVSADGDTCEYKRDDGAQVSLVRLPLNGQSPQDALAPVETSLRTLLPPRDNAAAPPPPSNNNDKDSARIDVPGVHIDAHGDKAEVRVMGVTIDADNQKAHVNAGLGSDHAVVTADEHGAEVRATEVDNVNANLVLVLASEKPGPSGLRSVGYIARGPAAGPLVVAEFKSAEHHTGFNDDHDINKLMERNLSH